MDVTIRRAEVGVRFREPEERVSESNAATANVTRRRIAPIKEAVNT
jgi:hypothetical protein